MKIIKKLSISTFVLASAISIAAVSSHYAPILASEKLKNHSSVSIDESENNSNEVEINLIKEDEFFAPSTLSVSTDDSLMNVLNFMHLSEHDHNHEDEEHENKFRIIRYCACCDNDFDPSSCRQIDLAMERAKEADRIAKENGIESRKIYSYDEAERIGNKISLSDRKYIDSLLQRKDESATKEWNGVKLILKIPASVCRKILDVTSTISNVTFGLTEFVAALYIPLSAIHPILGALAYWIGLITFAVGMVSSLINLKFAPYELTGVKFTFLFGFILIGEEKLL